MKSKSLRLSSQVRRMTLRLGCVFVLMSLPALVSASYLTGSFGQAPSAGTNGIVTFQTGTTGFIDFCPENTATPTAAGCTVVNNGVGNFNVTGAVGLPGAFTGAGTILDIASATGNSPFTYVPIGNSTGVANFMTIAGLNFIETNFLPESCTTTATQACVGGFQFGQAGTTVTVTVVFSGTVANSLDSSNNVSAWTDVITGQYTNQTMAAVLAAATSAAGIDSNSWSGSVTLTATPEPGTIGLMGSSLIGLGLLLRRKIRAGKV